MTEIEPTTPATVNRVCETWDGDEVCLHTLCLQHRMDCREVGAMKKTGPVIDQLCDFCLSDRLFAFEKEHQQ
jgi:hypothetical protein